VTGLLARGGCEVDIEWADGVVVEATIHSLNGTPGIVRYGDQIIEINIEAGEIQRLVASGS
jgi:alpha-L-fucosidase 2